MLFRSGLWDQLDGFYYDQLELDSTSIPLRVRSLVGIIPLFAVEVLDNATVDRLPGFKKRLEWFIANHAELSKQIAYTDHSAQLVIGENGVRAPGGVRLLAVPSAERLTRMLKYILAETEFLSPYGMRSLSKIHADFPYRLTLENKDYGIDYCPGDSNTDFFGGNSNWRGPVWFPINALLIEALDRKVDAFMPTGLHRAYVTIFKRYASGDRDGAMALFHRLLPILAFSNQHLEHSIHFFKRLL